jgi:hypothetical protein
MAGLSVLPGNFFGGGGLVNQLKKVSIAVDTTCSAKSNSGSNKNHQGAVALQQHAQILLGHSSKFCPIESSPHLPFCEEVAS